MLFNSTVFIFVFLPITALGFALAGRWNARLTIAWLVLCSLFFYGFWNPIFLLLLCASIVMNYACASALAAIHDKTRRTTLLVAGITANLAVLAYFKYAGFFLEVAGSLTGANFPAVEIILPLGISFFTFQKIGYLVDSWKGNVHHHRFLDYCLFVTFFPQLIAGPIVQHHEILPQIASRRRFRFDSANVAPAILLFVLGLAKKVLLADNVSEFANAVFNSAAIGQQPAAHEAWIGAIAYSFQLYFDFSGYSDMAIGLARLFGIHIPINFNSPYKAASIADFWRRWHITLSQFLRVYLYIPLGGNRCGLHRQYFNVMATMLLSGLWHGAGWTFIIWGGLHGFLLCVQHAARRLSDKMQWNWTASLGWHLLAVFLTFTATAIGWVFFRAADFDTALQLLSSMAGFVPANAGLRVVHPETAVPWLLALGAIVWLAPNTQQIIARMESGSDLFQPTAARLAWLNRMVQLKPSYASGVAVAILFALALSSMSNVQEFLYFQF